MRRKFAGGGIFDKLKYTGFVCLFLFVIACTMTNIVLAALSTGIEGGFSVIYDVPQDLWDRVSQIFDKSNVNKLLWQISGDSTATVDNMAPIEALAATRMTSADMIANYNKVNAASADEDSASANAASASDYLIPANDDYSVSSKDYNAEIIIEFCGLKWTPVYLSTTNEGKDGEPHDVILTLWLTDNQQDVWTGRAADEGDYYGFLDGALYSDWSANWEAENPTETYPANMYGTSYIRVVTLNNGGTYATSGTEATTVGQSKDSAFATFTMPEFGLTQYLVTPEQVSWQESGQSAKDLFGRKDDPNDNWGDKTKVPDTGFVENGKYNYADKEGNDAWKNDYIWLPSLCETGYDNTYNGFWKTSAAQRSIENSSESRRIGKDNGSITMRSMLRSGDCMRADYVGTLFVDGNGWSNLNLFSSYGVRPALHLNLTAVAKSLHK